jgi:hypothetical protein
MLEKTGSCDRAQAGAAGSEGPVARPADTPGQPQPARERAPAPAAAAQVPLAAPLGACGGR